MKRHIDDLVFRWEEEVDEILTEMGFPQYKAAHKSNDEWAAERECPADFWDGYPED